MSDPGDVFRVALTWTGVDAAVAQNVWHLIHTGNVTVPDAGILVAVALNVAAGFVTLKDIISDQYSMIGLQLWRRNLSTHKWDGIDEDTIAGAVGLETNDIVAHGVACVVRYVNELLRRQGRHFVPGITENETLDGEFIAAAVTDVHQYFDELSDPAVVSTQDHELCTYNDNPLSPHYETESIFQDVYFVNEIIAYQRRRKPLVGI